MPRAKDDIFSRRRGSLDARDARPPAPGRPTTGCSRRLPASAPTSLPLPGAAEPQRWAAMTRKLEDNEVAVRYNPEASTLLESLRRGAAPVHSPGFSRNRRLTLWQQSDIWSPTLSVL